MSSEIMQSGVSPWIALGIFIITFAFGCRNATKYDQGYNDGYSDYTISDAPKQPVWMKVVLVIGIIAFLVTFGLALGGVKNSNADTTDEFENVYGVTVLKGNVLNHRSPITFTHPSSGEALQGTVYKVEENSRLALFVHSDDKEIAFEDYFNID